jgi:NitT/TauT family transport system ATP-binding protein
MPVVTQPQHAPNVGLAAAGISFRDIDVMFRGSASPVLSRVSLDLQPGRITAILGPSGCGKSTMLRLIAGLLKPTQGELDFLVNGKVERTLAPGQLAYVFQDAALLPWRTVLSNTTLPMELLGQFTADERRSRAAEQLEAVGLRAEQLRKTPAELSGGMRMRVSIARALVTDPSVLLLDEPFAALDDILRSRLGEMVVELWQRRQRTIVLVTHNIAEAILLSQQILVMGYGTITDVIPVELEHSPDVDLRTTNAFTSIYKRVSDSLRAAVAGREST